MKKIKTGFLLLLLILLLLPLATFRWEEDASSEIDNRKLTHNPFTAEPAELVQAGGIKAMGEQYLSDRLGWREQMIKTYTEINDRLFGELVHPIYAYGKDGYIYRKPEARVEYGAFHAAFVDFVAGIAAECEARGIPFTFVLNPNKESVYPEYLPEGYCYDRAWAERLCEELRARGVSVVDNIVTLQAARADGEDVFNVKYDAGHWNHLGAYYGVNAILTAMQQQGADVRLNEKTDFVIREEQQTKLPTSQFPIDETVTVYELPEETDWLEKEIGEKVQFDQRYHTFYYRYNQELAGGRETVNGEPPAGVPRTLCFQGSYMNVYGHTFMENALPVYIGVHAYENSLDYDYYLDTFAPDYVIFEVAEYAVAERYFPLLTP